MTNVNDYTPTTEEVREVFALDVAESVMSRYTQADARAQFDRWLASVRDAALDEAAEVAERDAAKWDEWLLDSDQGESAVGRMYAAYRDTAQALALAIRALKEEKK